MESSACQMLVDEVISRDLCTLCGACVGMCPYFLAYQGRIVLRDTCNLAQGRCRLHCPRTSFDPHAASQALFGKPYVWDDLGAVREILMVRSGDSNVRNKAQYGGTVTSLVLLALQEGMIDSAVMTRSGDRTQPEGVMAFTAEEVLACAGSSYIAAPTIAAFNQGIRKNERGKVGVVCVPCQAMALSKMVYAPGDGDKDADRLGLVIGLFCTWALSFKEFAAFLKTIVSLPEIVKVDIPPPPANVFEVYTTSDCIAVPLDSVRPFIRSSCSTCTDMTAEFTDISVGAAEGVEGWNTLIVRTQRGQTLVDKARAKAVLEVAPLPEANLDHLKTASLQKKRRGLKNLMEKSGRPDDLLYLDTDPVAVKCFLDSDV